MENLIHRLAILSVLLAVSSCIPPYTYRPSTMRISRKMKVCDTIYLLPPIVIAKNVYSFDPADYSINKDQTKIVEDISKTLIGERLANKFDLKTARLDVEDYDSLKNELQRMIKVFYLENKKNYRLNLLPIRHSKNVLGLCFITDWEIRNYYFLQSLVVPSHHYYPTASKCQASTHLCLFDMDTGQIIYYKYNFKEFQEVYEPNSQDQIVRRLSANYKKPWQRIIEKELRCMIRLNSCSKK